MWWYSLSTQSGRSGRSVWALIQAPWINLRVIGLHCRKMSLYVTTESHPCTESLATLTCTFPTSPKRFLPGASLSARHLSMFLCRPCRKSRDLGDSLQQNVICSLSVVDSGVRNFRSSNFGIVKPFRVARPPGESLAICLKFHIIIC